MVRVRSVDELILNAIDFYKTAQPQLDTKPGTVSRDLLIDGPNTQLARVYEELARIRTAQSLRLSLGSDLDKLGNNYGLVRKQGSTASGIALYTFNAVEADISINIGDTVVANNGASFRVTSAAVVSPVNINQYRATASKFRFDLDFVGITDEYAIEISVESTGAGVLGNISKYQLISSSTPGVSNITNSAPFSGGSSSESDEAFKNRIFSIFSGAQTGTALGYSNAVRADRQVLDAIVIEPGDPLMTRDGTIVNIAENGVRTIVSEGTGGKVDVYVQGVRLTEILDSYIYRDQSNKNDPTSSLNDFVLGQIDGDEGKTVSRKRIDNLEIGILPDQPVNNIITVSGSTSGANFVERSTDSLGRITGNYELIRDAGAYGGSPWGFDRLHWIDDRIRDFSEEQTKSKFNGQDVLTFTDITRISSAIQNVPVVNENSRVFTFDRSSIQLSHYPMTAVTRVFNFTTGERYVITGQNPDGTGSINNTGRIVISGNTLPATSDVLQVDYTWLFNFDPDIDFDNKLTNQNPRAVADSVDWGFSNAVRREEAIVAASGSLLRVEVTHPISSVISVNTFESESSTVQLISGRLGVVVSNIISNVVSVARSSDSAELYDTDSLDGSFSGMTIFLPTDTVASVGDSVVAIYNANDTFTVDAVTGSFSDNVITLPSNTTVTAGTIVEANYISNIRTLLPQTLLPALPALRNGNAFVTSTVAQTGTQPTTNVYSGTTVVQNLRKAPSRLQLVIAGSISPGTITVSGTTFARVYNAVFTVSNSGLIHNLSSVIRSVLGLSSNDSIPTSVSVVKVTSVEKVVANDSFDVLSIEHEYDMQGYGIKNNSYDKSESIQDIELLSTQFSIASTPSNTINAPTIGNSLRVTFFIGTTSDTENVSFSKSGTLSTQKIFATIDSVSISSGFTSASSQSGTLTINNMNQPATGNRYTIYYDYIAPKSNERITIKYNKNSVITNGTLLIENVRPISADVLAKSAIALVVDVELDIIVTSAFKNSLPIVKQNVQDAVTAALNTTSLGRIIDRSDMVNVCYSVNGVDAVDVIAFNLENEAGSVPSIKAQKNEYIQAGLVTVNVRSR